MPVKSEIDEKKPQPSVNKYPLLMRYVTSSPNTKFIILKISRSRGVVVWSENPDRPVGYSDGSWSDRSEIWEVFEGSLTLSNEE